jgi:hypothetical protein
MSHASLKKSAVKNSFLTPAKVTRILPEGQGSNLGFGVNKVAVRHMFLLVSQVSLASLLMNAPCISGAGVYQTTTQRGMYLPTLIT